MKFENVKNKIKRPPSVHNLVRLINLNDELKTTKNVVNFALSIPSFNYASGTKMCVERVSIGLDLATALKAVERSGAPAGRAYNADFITAFFNYDEERRYSASQVFESYHGQYRISRDINVPTSPTFTIIENKEQVPVVLCGWKDLMLDKSQIQMWMTMLESGLFSYGDYRHSPGEVAIFPEQGTSETSDRQPLIINRGDYALFSEPDMREIAAMYARAQEAAMPIAEQRWNHREQARKQRDKDRGGYDSPSGQSPTNFDQKDLFAKDDDDE